MTEFERPVFTRKSYSDAFESDDLGQSTTDLPSPEQARSSISLTSHPSERLWLISGFLARAICGLIVAPGGTGKSFVTLSLAVAVATGNDFLGMSVAAPGSVAIIAAEDDLDELHRRLFAILQRETEFMDEEEASRLFARAQKNLYIVSRVGEDNRLLIRDPISRALTRSPFFEQLTSFLCHIPDLRLVIGDPLSRLSGGEENSAEDATRIVEALELLRKASGATVLTVHHANKGAIRSGDATQAAARGSSALTDGMRWQAQLRVMTADEAPLHGLTAEDARRFVSLSVTKSNYAPPRAPQWLERRDGGVLVATSLDAAGAAAFRTNADLVITTVRIAEGAGTHWTRRGFVRAHGGKGGPLGVAEKPLQEIVASLLATGRLILKPGFDARSRSAEVLSATVGEGVDQACQ